MCGCILGGSQPLRAAELGCERRRNRLGVAEMLPHARIPAQVSQPCGGTAGAVLLGPVLQFFWVSLQT